MSSTSTLEAQIAALIQRLEEMKEAEQWENECKEVEAVAESIEKYGLSCWVLNLWGVEFE